MTDEDVLEIAQGLSPVEWNTLRCNVEGFNDYDSRWDPPLVEKGLVVVQDLQHSWQRIARVTPLGFKVWEWAPLFWTRGND